MLTKQDAESIISEVEAIVADEVKTSKQVMITIRLSAFQRNEIKRMAAASGMSLQQYCLMVLGVAATKETKE